jgi:hypothetical protein
MRGALARLHVLEGHVVPRLAAAKGVVEVPQHLARRADGLMSISMGDTPNACMRRAAFSLVRALVAKPGMVTPRMLPRGSPSRS